MLLRLIAFVIVAGSTFAVGNAFFHIVPSLTEVGLVAAAYLLGNVAEDEVKEWQLERKDKKFKKKIGWDD